MQIVIDIPENDYELALRNDYSTIYKDAHIAEAIKNGTPLKRHGRLKDIDRIISDGISKGFCDWYDEMKMADTIIEADKEK